MSWGDPFWWPHKVLIRPLLAGGGMGPRLATSTTEADAEVDDSQRMIRDADSVQVMSSARVTVPLDTVAPLGSEVTLWPGRAGVERTAAVIATAYQDNGDGLGSQLVLSLE
ncbi:hypothetical protein ACEYYH_10485 [Microbacterium trichothecenolyticum]|uniref:hypothetical protein n=1 Tax=Microbacterium trichothecenolyticum TaxID=69370 RepID=UPI0035BE1191